MKIALVHELLTMRGGAEKVLRILAEMFPEAPIYTPLYNEEKLGAWFPKERVRTSRLQKWADRLPLGAGRYNHHLYLPFFPRAVEAWSFDRACPERNRGAQDDFDVVISSSSAFAHGIITNGKPKHLCYVHSPARYLWDRTSDILKQSEEGLLGPLKKAYLSRMFSKLRTWDAEAADRPDMLIAASRTVQRRIELYWRRKSEVIYPPIDDFWFESDSSNPKSQVPCPKSYCFIASTLVPYKRIDIAIEACNQRKIPLKISGEGPDRKRLQSLAGDTIEFLGYISEKEVKGLYMGARATLFPGDEDFGLVPLESLACGTPVIAYRSGGVLETMKEGETAEFFDEPTAASLLEAMDRFERNKWMPDRCRSHASGFSRQAFEERIRSALAALVGQSVPLPGPHPVSSSQ